MNKSRFENLEHERPAAEREPKSDLSRFAAPEAQRTAQEGGAVDAPNHLPEARNPIERFAASGDDGVALQLKDDAEQPFRRCPSCRRDSTRYETVCRFCRTALDSPEAIAFNQELWKRMQADSQLEKAQLDAAHATAEQISREQHERLLEAQQQLKKELDAHDAGLDGGSSLGWRGRLGLAVAGLAMVSVAFRGYHLPAIARVALGGLGLVFGVAAVPAGFWRYTGNFNKP